MNCALSSLLLNLTSLSFQLDKKIGTYVHDLPILKNETHEITIKIKQLSQEVDNCKRATESISLSNRDALKKIESLNDELVDEEEVVNLLSDKEKVEQELNEIKEHESATHARFLESHHKKEELKKGIDEAQKLIESLNLPAVMQQKAEKEKTVKDLEEAETKLATIREDLEKVKTDYKLQIAATKKRIDTKKKKIKVHQKKCNGMHKENENHKKVLAQLEKELEEEKVLLEKSKQEMEQVLIVGEQTLQYLCKGTVSVHA